MIPLPEAAFSVVYVPPVSVNCPLAFAVSVVALPPIDIASTVSLTATTPRFAAPPTSDTVPKLFPAVCSVTLIPLAFDVSVVAPPIVSAPDCVICPPAVTLRVPAPVLASPS